MRASSIPRPQSMKKISSKHLFGEPEDLGEDSPH